MHEAHIVQRAAHFTSLWARGIEDRALDATEHGDVRAVHVRPMKAERWAFTPFIASLMPLPHRRHMRRGAFEGRLEDEIDEMGSTSFVSLPMSS